jgi:hypothetical protein
MQMAEGAYQSGRNFYSPNARLYLPKFNDAVSLANESLDILRAENWTCKKYLVERTGYTQLEEFIGYFIRPDEEKLNSFIEQIIKPKFKSLDSSYIYTELRKFPLSTLRTCATKYLHKSWTFEEYLDNLNAFWVKKTNNEIPFGSDWYSCPPVLEQSNLSCEHHKHTYKNNHTSCPHIRMIRTAMAGEDLSPSVIELDEFYRNKMLEETVDLGIELEVDGIDDERFEQLYEEEVFDGGW